MAISPAQPPDPVASPADLCAAGHRDSPRRPFLYLADPICIASILLYILNRWVLKPHHIGGWFTHGYLNDVLCLPLFLPIILRIQSVLGIRRHDLPPTLFEVLHNWLIFSIVFKGILPHLPMFTTADDPWDVLAYLAGGVAAYVYWNRGR